MFLVLKINKMFTFLPSLLLTFLTVGTAGSVNEIEQENQHCICVPYWQCKDDYSGLLRYGDEVIEIRNAVNNDATIYDAPCTNDFDVCCPVECGNRKVSSNNDLAAKQLEEEVFGFRILGENNNADFAEFPWMLGILENRHFRCGASLIHPQVAVTAAHCVGGKGPFKIRAGEWNWESTSEPLPHQDRLVKKIVIHPRYQSTSLQNDIAIVILKLPFKLTDNVGLICLPAQGVEYDTEHCVVAGWGKNFYKKGTYQATLKKVELPLVPRKRCLKTLQEAKLGSFFNLHNSFICAGGEDHKDACKGDGGSPLVCPVIGRPERYHQVGIVSWGLTCGLQNTPGVYVNVELFISWIKYILKTHDLDSTIYKSV